MSEPRFQAEDPGARIFRASLPGWQSGIMRSRAEVLFAPGRRWLEVAVLLAGVAILEPVAALPATAAAMMARRAGNSRWLAALVASVWCGFLGALFRCAIGGSVFP